MNAPGVIDAHNDASWCQGVRGSFCAAGCRGLLALAAAGGRRVGVGSGSGLAEEPVPGGCEPAALATESFPRCPPGLLCGPAGVGLEAGEDGVAEAALERAGCFFGGLALGELAGVVGAAVAVAGGGLGGGGPCGGGGVAPGLPPAPPGETP